MVNKVRVHELAKELDLASDELLEVLKKEGIDVTSHLSGIDSDIAELVREQIMEQRAAKVKKAAKRPEAVPPIVADDEEEAEVVAELPPKLRASVKPPRPVKPVAVSEHIEKPKRKEPPPPPSADSKEISLKSPITVKSLAEAMQLRPNALIQELMSQGVFATINESLEGPTVEQLCAKHGFTYVVEKRIKAGGTGEGTQVNPEDIVFEDAEVSARPPVVAFLGHVDHGKTSLLDRIRSSDIVSGEAGGITQHIGASQIEWNNHKITFIDTPGHEAFTSMRARGANTTDIVVLVVAADDGFMPQTVEALNHARAAKVPIIVAANKMDLPGANVDKIFLHMQQNGLTAEDWGGDVGVIQVSAATGDGIQHLLERIVLETEMLELKANPELPVRAVVLESQLEQGHGPTVSILVKNGSISVGDIIICGPHQGKVKALIDSQSKRVKKAGPSEAVKVVGLSGLPECGMVLVGCKDDKQARKLAENREDQARQDQLQSTRRASLDDLFRQIEEENRKDLNVIVKADVQGTSEAVVQSLKKLDCDKIHTDVVHAGVGAVTENDVLLAAASDAIIVGFHVRVNPGVNKLAKDEGVEIRLYSIIYELIEQVRSAMEGMLEPELREVPLGQAEILKIFDLSRGKVIGCRCLKGNIRVGKNARVLRDKEIIYNGVIQSLRRFTDDVREVDAGLECGIRLDNFMDFEPGDIVQCYDYIEEKVKL